MNSRGSSDEGDDDIGDGGDGIGDGGPDEILSSGGRHSGSVGGGRGICSGEGTFPFDDRFVFLFICTTSFFFLV